ncbi:MAG: hypothetical protein HKO53_09225 [Gemmatimonadetes bacterium]|nr:hypothetical protein [Gemmatimonadota bacterium]NNM33236.1 hypothetical protein [Gemmatimonadota bacterium]
MSQGESDLPGPTDAGGDSTGHRDPDVLRAKYRDYCSARVADVLLTLTPDEIFVIAEAEARRRGGHEGPASYSEAVDLATQRVRHQLNLPDFAAWAVAYEAEPSRFDPLLLGLWETEEGNYQQQREDAAS